MSAIGEYVHLTAYGYAAYGTERFWTGNIESHRRTLPTVAMNVQKQKIRQLANSSTLNRLNEKDKTQIENQISSLMVIPPEDGGEAGIRIAWQMICDQLKLDFYESVPDQIQKNTGEVTAGATKIGTTKKGQHLLSTLLDRVQVINGFINKIQSGKTQTELLTILQSIQSQIQDISGIAAAQIQNFAGQSSESAKDFLKRIKKRNQLLQRSDEQVDAVITLINKAINIVKGVSSYVKGQMFELVVAISQLKTQQMTREAIENLLKSKESGGLGAWAGKNQSFVKLKSYNFTDSINVQDLSKTVTFNEDLKCYVDGRSSDKVDVYYEYQGQKYNASLKNVNLYAYPYISLVTGASLLALMQSMDYDFVNHYLNISATHYAMPPGSGKVWSIYSQYPGLKTLARQTMDLSLLLSAFIGHKLDADTADIFIVNNNSAGKGDPRVRVFNIGELIAKAVNDISLVQVSMSPEEEYTNAWEDTVDERLTKLLQKVHSIKVKVKFSNSALGMTH